MTRFCQFTVFIVALSLFVEASSAQDVKIGGGRLLRKWRDDVLGSEKQQKNEASKQKSSTRSSQKQNTGDKRQVPGQPNPNFIQASGSNSFRQPEPGNPPLTQAQHQRRKAQQQQAELFRRQQAQQQLEAQRQSNGLPRQPNANEYNYYRQTGVPGGQANSNQSPRMQSPQPLNPQARGIAGQSAIQHQRSSGQSQTNPNQIQRAAQTNATQNAKRLGPPAIGFGLELKADKNEQIYVSDVDRNGNAANAGIKKGDYVVEMGGTNLASVEEFEEIAKVMSNGDQLELKISRKGRTAEVLLTFGEAPEVPEETEYLNDPNPPQSLQQDASERYEFVPQPGRQTELNNGPIVNPRAFDSPSPPPKSTRPSLPEIDLELELPVVPARDSVLEID